MNSNSNSKSISNPIYKLKLNSNENLILNLISKFNFRIQFQNSISKFNFKIQFQNSKFNFDSSIKIQIQTLFIN